MAGRLQKEIHDANIAVHRFEAANYELLHPEVYSREEQQRINSTLRIAEQLIAENKHRVLDFGAGTGNLTGKLLKMGYTVTAVDISTEMCSVMARKYPAHLKTKKLVIINSSIEEADFEKECFDLITCYSVLHHLPNYESILRKLLVFLRKGGVIYLDHEASPAYWNREKNSAADLAKSLYFHSNPILNALYFSMTGVAVPSIDYTLSDYWHKKEHPIDHRSIERIFEEENFVFLNRTDYHSKGTWIPNPIFYVYRYLCEPEMSYWIAKK